MKAWHQELADWDALTDEDKEVTEPPTSPQLWNITNVTSDKQLMAKYHAASSEEKAR